MERITNPLFFFFVVTALVWIYRSRLALKTLNILPAVEPREAPDPGLNTGSTEPQASVIIPAKNEEQNIGTCLESLLRQDFPSMEIIVINDNSTDKTEEILLSMGAQNLEKNPHPDARLKYINAPKTQEGWTGKNFAIHCGVSHAQGSWLIFTDADTQHEPESIRASVYHAESRDLAFLTLLPRCLAKGIWENIIQPPAMSFMGLWFPMEYVNHPKAAVYFGNGQFLMMKKSLYKTVGGHASVRGEFLEDFALMKKAKLSGNGTQCALGTQIYGTRMYDSLSSIWKGWRRIYLHAFQRNPVKLASKALGVVAFSVLPFACLVPAWSLALKNPATYGMTMGMAAVISLFILGTCARAYQIVKANQFYALCYPLAALCLTGILADALVVALTGKKTEWR